MLAEKGETMSEWRPIETAPKDGTLVDLWSATYNARLPDCKFEQEEWDEQGHWYQAYSENPSCSHYVSDDALTHWMPRPPAPSNGDRKPGATCSVSD